MNEADIAIGNVNIELQCGPCRDDPQKLALSRNAPTQCKFVMKPERISGDPIKRRNAHLLPSCHRSRFFSFYRIECFWNVARKNFKLID